MTTATASPATAPDRPVAPAHGAARAAPRLRLLRYEPEPEPADVPAGQGRRRPVGRPSPPALDDLRPTAELRRRAHQVLRLTLEVLDGRRPPAHLTAHLEPSALRYVRAAGGSRSTTRATAHLTSLHVSRPCAGALEVAAVHRAGGRARVLAARFEGRPDDPGGWRCSTLRLL
jgi:Family of unknown function (DUF6459)